MDILVELGRRKMIVDETLDLTQEHGTE